MYVVCDGTAHCSSRTTPFPVETISLSAQLPILTAGFPEAAAVHLVLPLPLAALRSQEGVHSDCIQAGACSSDTLRLPEVASSPTAGEAD